MKVIIINVHPSKILGGSEIQCHQIATGLVEESVETYYLAVRGMGNSEFSISYNVIPAKDDYRSISDKCLEIKPDVIYWRYNKKHLYKVLKAIKSLSIPIIFSASNAYDLKPFKLRSIEGLSKTKQLRRYAGQLKRGWYHFKALKLVSGIICNNEDQLSWSKHRHKVYIPNSPYLSYKEFNRDIPYVVWVGNLKYHKRPELFLKLAEEMNNSGITFLMVGKLEEDRFLELEDEKLWPSNFQYFGPLPIEETNGIIRKSLFLVHTGGPEGFPNVFLQTWGFSKPVLSIEFDPAGLINSRNVGLISGSFEQLKKDINRLYSNKALREEYGQNAKQLIEEKFIRERNVGLLLAFIRGILK